MLFKFWLDSPQVHFNDEYDVKKFASAWLVNYLTVDTTEVLPDDTYIEIDRVMETVANELFCAVQDGTMRFLDAHKVTLCIRSILMDYQDTYNNIYNMIDHDDLREDDDNDDDLLSMEALDFLKNEGFADMTHDQRMAAIKLAKEKFM